MFRFKRVLLLVPRVAIAVYSRAFIYKSNTIHWQLSLCCITPLIYPFLNYAIVAWGNTYKTTLKPLINLQKKAVRIMTFSDFSAHSSPLFVGLKELLILNNTLSMYGFHAKLLSPVLKSFFTSVDKLHQYNTRLASKRSYYLPKIRTNYAKFNFWFFGVKIWNSIQDDFKSKSRISFFKKTFNRFHS